MINLLGIYFIFTDIILILIFTSSLVIFPSIPSDDHGVITSEWLEYLLIIEVYIYIYVTWMFSHTAHSLSCDVGNDILVQQQ